jgi:hypothetical protein
MAKKQRLVPEVPINKAVLFLVYNRPYITEQSFEAIRRSKPERLYIAADGPNYDVPGELEKCEKVRQIVTAVDWDCEVLTLFRDENLGCKKAVSSAIDWFFYHEKEGIILEDDCLPSKSFFRFCRELLEKHRDDERIMHISGTNLHFGKVFGEGSYFFSRYNLVWGWATWRRAWKYYDVDMKSFPEFKKRYDLENILTTYKEFMRRMVVYDAVYKNEIETWDFQWHYATRINNGLAIHPNVNLVQNIGFSEEATHTIREKEKVIKNSAQDIDFPLTPPKFTLVNRTADEDLYINYYLRRSFFYHTKELVTKPPRDFLRKLFDRL